MQRLLLSLCLGAAAAFAPQVSTAQSLVRLQANPIDIYSSATARNVTFACSWEWQQLEYSRCRSLSCRKLRTSKIATRRHSTPSRSEDRLRRRGRGLLAGGVLRRHGPDARRPAQESRAGAREEGPHCRRSVSEIRLLRQLHAHRRGFLASTAPAEMAMARYPRRLTTKEKPRSRACAR